MKRWGLVASIVGLTFSVAAQLAASPDPPSSQTTQQTPSPKKSRLGVLAERFIDEARQRMVADQRAKAERAQAVLDKAAVKAQAREREAAQRAAIDAARQKLAQEAARGRDAQRQQTLAQEYQLKRLYQRGQALYREGAYDAAVDVLEQMVLVAPDHALTKAAQRLITRAELQRFEQRLRASAELPPKARGAEVSELEYLLTHKRIEIDTLYRYAQEAYHDRQYDIALKLLTGVLVKDPNHREARHLMEEVRLAQLNQQRRDVNRQVELDERQMINDVLKAQVLPQSQRALPEDGRASQEAASALSAKLQEPISFEFNQVALADVLQFIAEAANVSVVPSPGVDLKRRLVTLKVNDMPLEQAVKYVTKSLSLAYRIDQDAILIATAEEFASAPMQTRVFFLRSGVSPFALETAALKPNEVLGMDSIKELIIHNVPQPAGSKFVLDERSGALVITNSEENLALVDRLLVQLDVAPVQVLIEARFIELTLADLEEFAFESVLNKAMALSRKEHSDHTEGSGHELASGSGSTFTALSREAEGLNLTLEGVLTGAQFEAVLHLLEESKRSKTLSAPRVTTLNHQTATIRVVDEFRYPTRYEVKPIQFDINGDGDFDDAGETEFANVPQDLQKRDVGILLHVTPSIGKDERMITLVLSPEVSSFSQFRDLGGGVTVPEFTTSQLTTSAVVENGQTVVLGGLMKDSTSEKLHKVPLLGDIPVVGNLFRQSLESNTRKNLLIFITPQILSPDGQTT